MSSATVGTVKSRNLVWVGGGAAQLVALNAATGAVVWSRSLGTPPNYVTWSSPALYDGSIYEGVASFNDCPVVDGSVYRINALTGAVQSVHRLSERASCVGPALWSSPAVDPQDNALYISTSNANPRRNVNATCQVSDQEAILELDAGTLAVRSHWAIPVSQQVGDSDFGASPMLFDATIGGVDRQLVGAENKNGIYYALDREDLAAGPLWTYTAEDTAALSSKACGGVNTISSSAWGGTGTPVMVAGFAVRGRSCQGTLAALNPATGEVEWQTELPGGVLGAVTEVPGVVAVGAGSSVELLSSTNGAVLFSYTEPKRRPKVRTGGLYGAPLNWFWSPPSIAGGTLYASNQDGYLRAFSP